MNINELSEKIRNATPFIKLLGIEVTQGAGGAFAEIRMPLKPEFTQHLGHAHGGVVGTLADIAANLACKQPTVTVEYKINFLKAASGEYLIARSIPLKQGSSLTIVQSDVFSLHNGEETKVATCLATLIPSKKPSQ